MRVVGNPIRELKVGWIGEEQRESTADVSVDDRVAAWRKKLLPLFAHRFFSLAG